MFCFHWRPKLYPRCVPWSNCILLLTCLNDSAESVYFKAVCSIRQLYLHSINNQPLQYLSLHINPIFCLSVQTVSLALSLPTPLPLRNSAIEALTTSIAPLYEFVQKQERHAAVVASIIEKALTPAVSLNINCDSKRASLLLCAVVFSASHCGFQPQYLRWFKGASLSISRWYDWHTHSETYLHFIVTNTFQSFTRMSLDFLNWLVGIQHSVTCSSISRLTAIMTVSFNLSVMTTTSNVLASVIIHIVIHCILTAHRYHCLSIHCGSLSHTNTLWSIAIIIIL